MLLVEHDMDAVFRIADRITVMVNGEVIASDVPERIRANPARAASPTSATSTDVTMPLARRSHDLHAHYGDSHVLRGVDARRSRPARSLGLLGRNGMGKTTLIRTLMGYVRADRRQRRMAGPRRRPGAAPERMAAARHRLRARRPRHLPEPVGAREPGDDARAPASTAARDWTLERVLATFPRLAERLGHGGQQLSGGEQQMLAIGRALMTNPQLLILDEATEGLAPLVVAEIWRVVARDPRDRHRHADRRPQLPRRARPHRPRGGAGKGPHRAAPAHRRTGGGPRCAERAALGV